MPPLLSRFYHPLRKVSTQFSLIYLVALFTAAGYLFLKHPIQAHDTDLWYHLAGGRYFFTHGSPPTDSFFSFLAPARERADYFWLFRVLIYEIHTITGYYGLIVLRAASFLALMAVVTCYLLQRLPARLYFFAAMFVALYMMVFLFRYLVVRPHILSYIFIPLFIYMLDHPSRKIVLLPPLAVLWCNLHGITYPLLMLICGSYACEYLLVGRRFRDLSSKQKWLGLIAMALTILAILATPHGLSLLKIPFVSTQYASQYIGELVPLNWKDLLSFDVAQLVPNRTSVFTLVLIAVTLTVGTSLLRRQIRVSHVLFYAEALALLFKGERFINEFTLLTLPIVKNYLLPLFASRKKRSISTVYRVVLGGLLIIVPFLYMGSHLPQNLKYLLTYVNLPVGVATFLKHVNVEGTLLSNPSSAGYMEWELYPKIKIAMDMQAPHLFSDTDYFTIEHALRNEEVFNYFSDDYRPSLVSVPINNEVCMHFSQMKAHYTLVFFDDSEALYVHNDHYPDIARTHGIKNIDPSQITKIDIHRLSSQGRAELLSVLLGIDHICPHIWTVNQLIAICYPLQGENRKAELYLNRVIDLHPERAKGYSLKGDWLARQLRFREAIDCYQKAFDIESASPQISRRLGKCYLTLKDFDKAYEVLSEGIKIFGTETTHEDLFMRGFAARRAGKTDEARLLMKLARLKAPRANLEWTRRISQELNALGEK